MPGIDLLIAFFLAAAVFAYMPGPSTLYAAAQTIARGRRGGLLAAAGLHVGGYVHVLGAAAGLAVLFDLIPVAYTVLKLAGAAYLIWLGLKFIFGNMDFSDGAASAPSRAFWDSVLVEVLNPKTAIFYVAFLPQFTDPAAALPLWSQLLILGTLVNVLFSSADLLCVLLAEAISRTLQRSAAANRFARRLGGATLIGLGVTLGANR